MSSARQDGRPVDERDRRDRQGRGRERVGPVASPIEAVGPDGTCGSLAAGDPAGTFRLVTDHYEVLQVARSAEPEVIRAAFRALARKYHPDSGGSVNTMKAINEAWAVLADSARRAAYDAAGPSDAGTGQSAESRSPTHVRPTVGRALDGSLPRPGHGSTIQRCRGRPRLRTVRGMDHPGPREARSGLPGMAPPDAHRPALLGADRGGPCLAVQCEDGASACSTRLADASLTRSTRASAEPRSRSPAR